MISVCFLRVMMPPSRGFVIVVVLHTLESKSTAQSKYGWQLMMSKREMLRKMRSSVSLRRGMDSLL